MPPLVWQVEDLRAPHAFTWSTHSPGVRTVGHHTLTANPDGTTHITLALAQTGPLASLVGVLTARRTRRFIEYEAAGLRAATESVG